MKLKRILAVALATTLVCGMTLGVSAKTGGTGGTGGDEGQSVTTSAPETTTTAFMKAVEAGTAKAGAEVKVAGLALKSTVDQVVVSNKIQGAVITTDKATLTASLGLAAGQSAKVIILDTDPKKSTAAMKCVEFAAEVFGLDVVSVLDIDLFATQNNKKIVLANGAVQMTAGLPKDADLTKQYEVIRIQVGGVITVVPATVDPVTKTIAFEICAGPAVYAISCK